MFAFLALLFVLLVIYIFTSKTEGFNPVNTEPEHKVNIPINIIPSPIPPPPARSMSDDDVKPSSLPGQLPVAPYEQIAAASPLPYQDPALLKANRQQLVTALENLKGFLAFEAQEISERSDPSIQLPLNTARGDFKKLQDEVYVLNRNPGLQSTITQEQLAEIEANLAFLQQTVRLIGAAGPIQGPIYEFTKNINVKEGFENKTTSTGQIASESDLKNFVSRLDGEIKRLSASGTTDPVVVARISYLNKIKVDIDSILTQLKSGILMTTEIPVMKKDIEKALPILGKPSEPLPQIIKKLNLPAGINNMLPSNLQNDPQVARQIDRLIDKYADDIVKGVSASASLNIKYTAPRETETKNYKITIDANGIPMMIPDGYPNQKNLDLASGVKTRLEHNDNNIKGNGTFSYADPSSISNSHVVDPLADKPEDAGRGPAHFDWKERAKQIEDQIKKRGLNPVDFGILPENVKVSSDFSWRGYARMICTRLQATMDPSLPETCGCPPNNWKGWNQTIN